MSRPSKACAAALIAASAALGGCQVLGGGQGVMPESEVGPPPSMRSAVPGRTARAAEVDPDGVPLQTIPTRRLDLPKAPGAARGATAQERRIRREDIEGETESRGGSGGSLGPQLGSGGGVGVGGTF